MTVIATTYDASIESTTASASALNRYFATPNRNITGKNTMIVVIVEASTGSATSLAPSRAASHGRLAFRQMAIDVFEHDRRVVDQTADREREAAQRHDVDSRAAHHRPKAPARIDSGIDRKIANVERKLPRKIRIISEARTAPETASCSRLSIAARTYVSWPKIALTFIPLGRPAIVGSRCSTPSTTAIVLALPCFITGMYTERWPLMRTMFC